MLPEIAKVTDLGGRTVAVPFWYSIHNILLQDVLRKDGLVAMTRSRGAALDPKFVAGDLVETRFVREGVGGPQMFGIPAACARRETIGARRRPPRPSRAASCRRPRASARCCCRGRSAAGCRRRARPSLQALAEMPGVSAGLGYFILDTRDRLAYSEPMAAIVLIGAPAGTTLAVLRTG